MRLDTMHPFYASHHQKIIAIDDTVAFVGGVDLTTGRWDTRAHLSRDRRRRGLNGRRHGPVRDVQMIVDSDAAVALADLVRERWRLATGEALRPCGRDGDVWPEGLEPQFNDHTVGISRTMPDWRKGTAVSEILHLAEDMLRSARDLVYVEAQYFCSVRIGRVVEELLERPGGPEVVVITSRTLPGVVETWAMGGNRDRLIRRLKKADREDRLRVYYPLAARTDGDRHEVEILVHSKVLIVDDRILRVGSSNLNNRSFGIDTECDLVIEADDEATAETIRRQCRGLMADLAGVSVAALDEAVRSEGSFLRGLDRLAARTGRLKAFSAMQEEGPTGQLPGTRFFDPQERFELPWVTPRRSGGDGGS
ncbi:phospholipase D-like domain-containing protein [Roseibium salinum]|uniref:Phospholipase D n=1 Tax=Roseibium salinum TaxID=1604349 RepID=A0ABT3R443_9HYPH|nr:phospholipase D-like domain-containing protein [Roseibium sp. DSM 29163]MCX2723964.1 phospholipase D-like domain-containing protein [Roseibium sp. DSM 29163]